ncbi:hypothetical protein VTO42DRAFT_6261 [Malbranchea cinnamomea]
MSVLRQGSSFLQRRLTKLYTDTKSSCESVSTATKPNDDPELIALNRNFRTQKDRLLAWGLDWSDANAAQPNDIDEALGEAGFSDVVASVMSSIQQVLNEAERMQQPSYTRPSDGLAKGGNPGGFPTASTTTGVKTAWTEKEIARSKELLDELTAHIDTLYDLSRSRRNISMGMASSTQNQTQTQSRPPVTTKYSGKSSKEFFESSQSADSKAHADQAFYTGRSESKKMKHSAEQSSDQFEMTPFINLRSDPTTSLPSKVSPRPSADSFAPMKDFRIDKAAVKLADQGIAHASNPPPYEAVAASANSRAVGQVIKAALPPAMASNISEPTIPVLVEFSPILLEMQNSLVLPRKERLQFLSETLERLVDNARVSHLGLLKFLGYFVDMTYSRYAFIYELPLMFFPLLSQPSAKMVPRPLVSLFYNGEDRHEAPMPNLEARFRLAYNLVLDILHLRSQNVVHGNINSNNVLIFPESLYSEDQTSIDSNRDFRHPYLTSLALFDGVDKNASPEPLSSSMYRHPDDRQNISDPSAWAYDLYSLGLVLLEIGLWTPLSRLWKMKYNATTFKSRIENVYVKKLGAKCGSAFLQMVQLCLDAPNFHLSTEPMNDLGLRLPQTYTYPWQDPRRCEGWSAFSKNFVYTIGKIIWRCCTLDIFSAPPAEDLEEHLPPPANDDGECPIHHEVQPQDISIDSQHFGRQFDEPTVPIDIDNEMTAINDSSQQSCEKSGDAHPEKRGRKRTVKRWNNDIPDDHLQQWNTCIMPKISKLLQKILKDSPESCGVSLMVAGESAETAKTTICVTCTSVRKVRAALKKYFDYDRENWDLIVIKGDVKRSKVPRRRRRKQKATQSGSGSSMQRDPNPYYQRKPLCGASIGAFRHDEHLPPVSYGGAILVDGVPYGMTVHHMLDSPCEDEEDDDDDVAYDHPPRSAGNYTSSLDISEPEFSYSWCDCDPPEALYPLEILDDEEEDDNSVAPSLDDTYDDYWLSDGYSSDEADDYADDYRDDDAASIGDTAGIYPGDEPRIAVTQPAIDDVDDDFFPNPEDKDDEHLASHMLGYVHASSGIRRWMRDGIKHEVDWALIKIDDSRMEARNLVSVIDGSASRGYPATERQHINLNKVAPLESLGGLHVHCRGRTSGLQTGRISKAMTLVKMHGRRSFSSSFSVDGNFGVPGDSGAWVFDETGQVCGHVLAYSEKSRTAFIAPMQILLDDIARTLGASSVALPDSQEAMAWAAFTSTDLRQYDQQVLQQSQGHAAARDSLPLELQKLSIEEPGHPRVGGGVMGRKDVSFRSVKNLMPQPRAPQRQIA